MTCVDAASGPASRNIGLDQYCDVRAEQNSRVVGGLQLADLVAHTTGVMLLETLGFIRKQVKAGAGLRYRFFHAGPVDQQEDLYQGALMDVGPDGLYISEACSAELRAAAMHRFGQCYLGCIH